MTCVALTVTPPAALELVPRADPPLGTGEVRLSVEAAGICHTDLYLLSGAHPGATYPRVPGHEFVGSIVEVGETVPENLRPGTRAAVLSTLPCLECPDCVRERYGRCRFALHFGTDRDGGWQSSVVLPWQAVIPLPGHVCFEEAVLYEPAANAVAAVEAAGVQPDDDVVVIGPGAIGLLTALVAAVAAPRSLTVVGLPEDAARLNLVTNRTGATAVVVRPDQRAAAIPRGKATVVLQCAPSMRATALGLSILDRGGRLIVEGYAGDTSPLPIGADELCQRALSLVGVNGWTPPHFRHAAELVAAGRLALTGLPVMSFPLSSHQAAVDAVRNERQHVRVLLRPQSTQGTQSG